jgi:hypothetical protein
MQLINKIVHQSSRKTVWNHYFLGDWHYPAASFDEDSARKIVKHISKDDHALVYLMGDMSECIAYDDKRFDPITILPEARNHLHDMHLFALDKVTEILAPISGKCVCIMEGNHEDKLRKAHQIDWAWRLRDNLRMAQGIKQPAWPVGGGDIAMVRVVYHKETPSHAKPQAAETRWLMSHGFGAGRTKGAKINTLMSMSYIMPDCDGFFMAHHHDKVTDRMFTLGVTVPKGNKPLDMYQRKHLLGITGSQFKTYEAGSRGNYASRRLYRPADLGCIYATVKNFTGEGSKQELDIRDLVL